MRAFWRAFFFLLPLAIIFGTPVLVLWLGGELISPDTIVQRQLTDARLVLHGPAYTNSAIYVKQRLLAQRRPKVLVLGNSRVLQFRREFFNRDVNFYNSGGTALRLQHFRAFLEKLPQGAYPETLLLAMEGGYFNAKFDKLDQDDMNISWMENQLAQHATPTEVFLGSWRDVWADIRAGKIKWARLFSGEGLRDRIGLNALFNDEGYRNDGSYQYAPRHPTLTNPGDRDYQFQFTLKAINNGTGRFPWGDTPSAPALDELDALLDFCASHRIHVIGFMPPHAHAVWMVIQELGERYAYLPLLEGELRSRFARRGCEFYNFSDLATLGLPDTDVVDGYHGNEHAYLRLFIAMLDQGSRLNSYANRAELSATLTAVKIPGGPFPPLP